MARVVMVGNFGLTGKGTMRARALPMARALASRGHAVSLVLPGPPESTGALAEGPVRITYVGDGGRGPGSVALAAVRLARTAVAQSPDVIHAFKPVSYAGAVANCCALLRSLRLSETRVVVDADDWEGTGGWVDAFGHPPPVKWLVDRQQSWALRRAQAVTVASRHLESLVWSLGVRRDRVFYFPNGCEVQNAGASADQGRMVRERLGLGATPLVLLYTRFVEFAVERVVRLVRALSQLSPEARLLVVGRGFHSEEGLLEARLREVGLGEKAVFAGWVEPEQLPAHFAAADVAIYPMDDNMINRTKCPAKLVELLAAGVPVVADAVGQTTEYILGGESGLLVLPNDEARWAGAVADLLGDERARRRLSLAAAARMRDQFSWHVMAPRLEAAYGVPGPSGGQ